MKNDWNRAVRECNSYPGEDTDSVTFHSLLAAQNQIYPHLGALGLQFLDLMKGAAPRESYDPDLQVMAARYCSHAGEETSGHSITYGPLALHNPHGFFQTRTHEYVHAVHCHTLAHFQAILGNHHSPVILAPADACLLTELSERAAFTIERLFKLKQKMALYPNAETSPLEYGFLHSPDTTIPQYAAACLQHIELDHEGYTSLMYYRDLALNIYQADMIRREESPHSQPTIIVRLSEANILATGRFLGLDLFSPQPYIATYSTDTLPVTNQQEQKLQYLENQLGITRQQELPTLSEALTELGDTETTYLLAQRKLQRESSLRADIKSTLGPV